MPIESSLKVKIKNSKNLRQNPQKQPVSSGSPTHFPDLLPYNDLMEGFFNIIPDLLCVVSIDGYFKKLNPAWESTLGYSVEELLSRPYIEFVHPDDVEGTVKKVPKQQFTGRESLNVINRYRCKDGTYRWLEWTSKSYHPHEIAFAVARDITDRIQNEEALRESEEKFRSLAEFSPNLIFINVKGKVVFVNRLCEKFTGYLKEHFYADDFDLLSITAPEFHGLIKEKFKLHMQGQEVEPYEYALTTKEGKKLYTVLNSKLIRFGGENAILGVITDITERKKAEMELEKANEELSNLNAAKDKFFSIIAHDLKNPFNTILWFAGSLLKDLDKCSKEEIKNQVSNIRNASNQAYLLVENLLLWAQSQNKSIEFQLEKLDITAQFLKNILMVKSQADRKKIQVKSNIQEQCMVSADKNMIDAILRNLLSNAIQVTPQNGEIVVSAERIGDELEISVQDNGMGIEKEDLDSIFKIEIKRNISLSPEGKGSGLGLILCKEFVERHGGKIWAESEIGKGSIFRFTIPYGHGKV